MKHHNLWSNVLYSAKQSLPMGQKIQNTTINTKFFKPKCCGNYQRNILGGNPPPPTPHSLHGVSVPGSPLHLWPGHRIHCLQEGHRLIHLQAEKNSSIGFRKGEYAGSSCIIIRDCAANHVFTRRKCWKATMSQMMTYTVIPGLSSSYSTGGNRSFIHCIPK